MRKFLKMHFLFNVVFFTLYLSPRVDANGLLQQQRARGGPLASEGLLGQPSFKTQATLVITSKILLLTCSRLQRGCPG